MQRAVIVALVAALLVLGVSAAPSADRVISLPDFNQPFPSKHYSGYATALNDSFLHYYLVEAAEVDPATAPVIVWLNGGPGCSSMDGWGYELGPFHFKHFGTDGPIFELNNFTWTKLATVIFLESPPGIGFSYSLSGDYATDDTRTAENNYAAIVDLMTNKFPEYLNNKFFVAGESYGGIYAPSLVAEIMKHNDIPNFSGMMVGNGVTDEDYVDTYAAIEFAYRHGLIPESLYEMRGLCDRQDPETYNPAACAPVEGQFYELTEGLNVYGVYYKCFVPPTSNWKRIPVLRGKLQHLARKAGLSVDTYLAMMNNQTAPPSPQGFNVPCIDSQVMTTYLNRDDVKKALHVQENLHWQICYGIQYTKNIVSVVPVYRALIDAKKQVMFYNGNIDMSVPYTGTIRWIREVLHPTLTRNFTVFQFNDPRFIYGPQMGGYAEEFDHYFWFERILGSGHMVPQFRPAAAYQMFSHFMARQWFS